MNPFVEALERAEKLIVERNVEIERLRAALQCVIDIAGEEEGTWEDRMEKISVIAHAAFHELRS